VSDRDDYLWDPSRPADPEVARLERLLAPMRYDPKRSRKVAHLPPASRVPIFFAVAMAAAFVLFMLGNTWSALRRASEASASTLEGVVDASALTRGRWMETARAGARIELAGLGVVDVAPDSRLRVLGIGKDEQRLELAVGGIHAKVVAPPRLFVVDTPSAAAVDLGCEYTLAVDANGAGILHVSWGAVSLEARPRTAFVPAGASCITRVGKGPGTPYFDDASPALVSALRRFDFEGGGRIALEAVLAVARPRDSLTLYHLLPRTTDVDRPLVYARLAELVPPPPGVTPDDVQKLDHDKLDTWEERMIVHW
jgi:hypothetical protein